MKYRDEARNGKIAVVTAITGGKDVPLPVKPKCSSAEYILYTDKVKKDYFNLGWDRVFKIPTFSNLTRPHRRNAKLPKVMPFLWLDGYQYVIWQDGGHMLQVDARDLIEEYLLDASKEIVAFQHGKKFNGEDHDCIYKEAKNIKRIGFLKDPAVIDEQVAAYRAEGFPPDFGLSCNFGMLWRNGIASHYLSLAWWEQICRYSSRDQMSLFYCLWKLGIKKSFGYMPGHWERNDLIRRIRGHVNPEQ